MEGKTLLFVIGTILILLNSPLAKGMMWWEKEIIKYEKNLNEWFYRIPWILIGIFFIIVSIVKA